MHTIIAGRFDEQTRAEQAVRALEAAGFLHEQIATFFVNPAGGHDLHGTHTDREASAGAHHAGAGALAGAATGTGVGALVGLATIPIVGPAAPLVGAAVGAYLGSLDGALAQMHDPGKPGETDEAPPRKSGMFVAVGGASSADQTSAIAVLRAQGAADLEQAQGRITQSQWDDFDPLSAPALVDVRVRTHAPVNTNQVNDE